MEKPRLIYYNDARHYGLYRYDPPMSLHQLRQPVDEILGTQVDLLSYGLASGQTFLHDTRVGLRWGEELPSHNHGVMWWRAAENARQAIEAGHDPLRVVVERAHEKGRRILCSLRMNDASSHADGNYYMFGRLKREHPEVMIGKAAAGDHPYAATCADFERQEVQAERLAVIEEVCGRYGADGLEMDPYINVFFAPAQGRAKAPVLTAFVARVRALLDRIGKVRGQRLILAARAHPVEAANLEIGMDVRAWLADGLVDLVVPVMPGVLLDVEMPIEWLAEAAHGAGALVYPMLSGAPYDDRDHLPTLEMYRAAATRLAALGADGLYLQDLSWPFGAREYHVLREMGDRDIYARKAKHWLAPRQAAEPDPHLPARPLPVVLQEGTTASVPVHVDDDLAAARADGELAGATLGVRVVQYCPQDELIVRLNGRVLSPARVETFYGGLVSYTAARSGLPERINTHYWFHFDLPADSLRAGPNAVEVTLARRFAPLEAERVLHDVEIQVAYREPAATVGGQM